MTLPGKLRDWFAEAVGTGLWTGLAPVAPATAASAVAVAAYWAFPFGGDSSWFFALTAASVVAGVWSANVVAKRAGDEDPSRVVSDEFAGMWAACLFLPKTWVWLLVAFLLFRALDIIKPFGIRRLEKIPGGIGIVADDLAARAVGSGWLERGSASLVQLADAPQPSSSRIRRRDLAHDGCHHRLGNVAESAVWCR